MNGLDSWKDRTKAQADALWSLEDCEEALVFVKGLCDDRIRGFRSDG